MYKSLYLVFKLHNKPMKARRGKSNVNELVGLQIHNYFNILREESFKDD